MNFESLSIIVIYYNLNDNTFEIRDIEKIAFDDKGDLYLKCIWRFSQCRRKIVFYIANMKKSKMVIWDCLSCDIIIRDTIEFDWSLLMDMTNNDNASSDPGPSSSLVAVAVAYKKINKCYDFPEMWFTYDLNRIIIRNPFNKSFISIMKDTDKNKIKTILEETKARKLDTSSLPEPVFIGRHIFTLGEEHKHITVIK